MWSPLLEPGLHLVDAERRSLRHFGQELTHFAVHNRDGNIRWFDGEHGFDPYRMAELNLERGRQADHGAERVLIKRCLTAFQWESQMDKEMEHILQTDDIAAVLAVPYDALFRHQELQDWEQEDYMRYNLKHLRRLLKQYKVPILAFSDMGRLWQSHPTLATMLWEQSQVRWRVDRPDGRWRVRGEDGMVIDPWLRRQVTLLDYVEEAPQQPSVVSLRPRKPPQILRR